ncbi:MAG: TrbC/VirB2 family protein [Burkholderiaceae bacterium]|nr:TrbC/VirB2 family protein [Burkholderiaceae bacterium]
MTKFDVYGKARAAAAALAALLLAKLALASSSGGGMPWDTPLTNLQNDLTGPVATAVGVIAFFAAGSMLVLGGEEMNSIVKKTLYIVLGVALVVLGNKALTYLGLTGALVF